MATPAITTEQEAREVAHEAANLLDRLTTWYTTVGAIEDMPYRAFMSLVNAKSVCRLKAAGVTLDHDAVSGIASR